MVSEPRADIALFGRVSIICIALTHPLSLPQPPACRTRLRCLFPSEFAVSITLKCLLLSQDL